MNLAKVSANEQVTVPVAWWGNSTLHDSGDQHRASTFHAFPLVA